MDESQTDTERIHHFEVTTGVDVVIHGDESRTRLARQVIDNRQALATHAVGLLDAFMRDRGEYDLSIIEAEAMKSEDGYDFSLRFNFVAVCDPHKFNYTYFEVYFACNELPSQPFWPHKLTVGFS